MQQLIDNMQNETKALSVQLKEVLVENEGYKSELERQSAELPHLRDQRQALTEQVESLQALWNHKQKENEALDEKNRALQKLNQTISVTLNQQRREIHQLKSEMEQERFASNEKIKTLISEVQMLRRQIVEDPDTDIKL